MNKYFLTGICIFFLSHVFAQGDFIVKGKIEFEKKTNIHKQLAMEDEGFRSMIEKMTPPTKTTYFDLYFNDKKTIYMPGREVATTMKVPEWIDGPATDNVVFTDLSQNVITSQKTIFEDVFNIQDSLRKAHWKITPDTRTIAGFECRKATTIIMDSVFVVAFYTEQIVTPGGPESFNSLPGMILGLAVPRLNTTWFATKLELVNVKDNTLMPPKKGKKIDLKSLQSTLNNAMKDWGKMGSKNIWQITI